MKETYIYVRNKAQLLKVLDFEPDCIIIEYELFFGLDDELRRRTQDQKRIVISLPHVLNSNVISHIKSNINKDMYFMCDSYDGLGLLAALMMPSDHIMLDAGLYAFSNRSVDYFRSLGYTKYTIPYELNLKEIAGLDKEGAVMMVYGRIPVMYSAQCVLKNTGRCKGKSGTSKVTEIVDRKNSVLPVICECEYDCFNIIYNSKPLYLLHLLDDIYDVGVDAIRLDFTVEDEKLTEKILDILKNRRWVKPNDVLGDFTKGHLLRGV